MKNTNTNPTVLTTGCSSGFGHTTASYFLARGWNVIATMRSPNAELFERCDCLLTTRLDVTNPQTISSAIQEGISAFGRIDAVVNNAGIGMFGAHEAVTDEVVREIFETNTFGVMALNRAIIPHMRERRSGTIINVTSSVGIAPMPLVAAYTASKFAIEGFSESLSYELGALGIRVKVVQPGLAPSTSFAANSGYRCSNTIPPAYSSCAENYLQSMQADSTEYTSAVDVAQAVFVAATDGSSRLRYPAGADSVMLAGLRESLNEHDFMSKIGSLMKAPHDR